MRARTRTLVPFIAVTAFLALGAAGLVIGRFVADRESESAATAPTSAGPSAGISDPNGRKACTMLSDGKQYGAWTDHVLVANVATAAKASTTTGIALAGATLEHRVAIANAAQGQRDQPEADRNLRSNLDELERECKRAGLG